MLTSLSACTKTLDIMEPAGGEPERVLEKNYTPYSLQHAGVGEKIIVVKDYWVVKTPNNKAKCSNDFTFQHPLATHSGNRGDTYDVVGTTVDGGVTLYLIEIPDISHLTFGITKEGKLTGFAVDRENEKHKTIMSLTPERTRFELISDVEVDPSRDFTHFEIIYNGVAENSMQLLYRSYASENTSRPASQRMLTYPMDTDMIRIEQTRIKILEATGDHISFTVLEDGYTG